MKLLTKEPRKKLLPLYTNEKNKLDDRKQEGKMKGKIVRPGKFAMTCITYKMIGEPNPLNVVDGVLVKDTAEKRLVEKNLKQLYYWKTDASYKRFLKGFILKDKGG